MKIGKIRIVDDIIQGYIFWFLLHRYFGKNSAVISSLELYDSILLKDGLNYKISEMALGDISSSHSDYDFKDIRETDIVLDIGAGCGGFTLPAARKAKKVYAVEPLFTSELEDNIQRNNIKNVQVIPFALGDYREMDISYSGCKKKLQTVTFDEVLEQCGGKIDFLKCDCEGAEWTIKPELLFGIRRLEIELHNSTGINKQFVQSLKKKGYLIRSEKGPNRFAYEIVHGYLTE